MDLKLFLGGVAVPAGLFAGALTLLGLWHRSSDDIRKGRWHVALATGVAVLSGFAVHASLVNDVWYRLPPTERWRWLYVGVVAATLVALLEALLSIAAPFKLAYRAIGVPILLWVCLAPLVEDDTSLTALILWYGGLSLAFLVIWALFELTCRSCAGPAVLIIQSGLLAYASLLIMASGFMKLSLPVAGVSAALGVSVLFCNYYSARRWLLPTVPIVVVCFCTALINSYAWAIESEELVNRYIAVACTPLMLLVISARKIQRLSWYYRTSVAAILVVVVGIFILYQPMSDYIASIEADPYAG